MIVVILNKTESSGERDAEAISAINEEPNEESEESESTSESGSEAGGCCSSFLLG